jgi:Uma2 family endonuclease
MVAQVAPPSAALDAVEEKRFVLRNVPWHVYVSLHDSLELGGFGARMTYLEGALELMSPSEAHEDYKKLLARLLEAYAEEADIDLNGRGSTTFREEPKERGLEPDECYSVGPFTGRPDLAIEVELSNPLVDKLAVYAGLGVREVWIWRKTGLVISALGRDGYASVARSGVLPELDVALLASFVKLGESQTKLVKAYRAALRQRV